MRVTSPEILCSIPNSYYKHIDNNNNIENARGLRNSVENFLKTLVKMFCEQQTKWKQLYVKYK